MFKIGKLLNGNLFILAIFALVKNTKSVWYIKFPWLAPKQLHKWYNKLEDLITLVRRMSIKEGLDRVGDDVDHYDQEADETNEKGFLEGALADVNQVDMLDTVKTRT